MSEFCKFIKNGLVYNNNTRQFTVSPCCYFSKQYSIDPTANVAEQYAHHRQSWSREDFSETCRICLDAEKTGKQSYRQASFDIVPQGQDGISMLTVAINKECNLACASCGSHSSSRWYNENKRNGIKEPQEIVDYHVDNHKGLTTDRFLSLMDNADLHNLDYIKFGGGEPLMTDTHMRVLERVKDPARVELQYTSNFSIMPTPQVADMWSRFKQVKWMASIDGTGDQFDLLRWPHTWDKLVLFVERALRHTPANVSLGIEHTLNMLNVYYFDRLEQWYLKDFCSANTARRGVLSIHNVEGIMTLDEVPQKVRDMVMDKLGNDHRVSRTLSQQGHGRDPAGSVAYLDGLDSQRGTNWRSTFPEVEMHYA